jgi:hypothetical protein
VLATLTGVLAMVLLPAMALDDRQLSGVSVWLKPWKFSVSIALYSLTVAWMVTLVRRGARLARAAATGAAVALGVEIAVITWLLRVGQYPPTVLDGGHTVDAPDGGPGLPVTNWSLQAGDLRTPHFVGIHALQLLPLLAWLLGRRARWRGSGRQVGLVHVAGVGYLGLWCCWGGRRYVASRSPGPAPPPWQPLGCCPWRGWGPPSPS